MSERGEPWWRDFQWEEQIVQVRPQPQQMKPMECVKCGAPMKTWQRCEYCGTHYGPEAPKEDALARMRLEELKNRIVEVRKKVDEAKRKRETEQMPCHWNEILSASKRWKDLGLLSR